MKRLLLISPLAQKSLMGNGFFFRLPCVGLLKVAALTPPGWEITIVDEKVEPLDLNQEADLVGITAVTTTVQRGYELADHFRKRGIKVVMGGMHVSCLPDEALEHCDSVVRGEAEVLWPKLLRDFEANQLKRMYAHENGLPSLATLPEPNWELLRSKNYLSVHMVETTRGCPIDCEFCAVTSAFGVTATVRPTRCWPNSNACDPSKDSSRSRTACSLSMTTSSATAPLRASSSNASATWACTGSARLP